MYIRNCVFCNHWQYERCFFVIVSRYHRHYRFRTRSFFESIRKLLIFADFATCFHILVTCFEILKMLIMLLRNLKYHSKACAEATSATLRYCNRYSQQIAYSWQTFLFLIYWPIIENNTLFCYSCRLIIYFKYSILYLTDLTMLENLTFLRMKYRIDL